MVQQQMQFNGSLGAPVARPVKNGQAQINSGRIQAIELILETKAGTVEIELTLAPLQELLKEQLI